MTQLDRRQFSLTAAAFFGLTTLAPGFALAQSETASANPSPLEDMLRERTMGPEDAPITIIEHSSLTCPHCRDFHLDTLPEVKEAYVDTGKARFVFSDFPLDRRAMAASMLARCVPEERYFGFINVLFRNQGKWASRPDGVEILSRYAQLAGLPEVEVEACLANEALLNGLLSRREQMAQQNNVSATPTIVINGRTLRGNISFATIKKTIEAIN